MPMESHRILLIEDNVADTELTVREMKRGGLVFEWRRVETEADVRRACEEFEPTVVLSDFAMPLFDGLSALRTVRELRPKVPFIFVSGTIGEETAIQSLRSGANDYILKSNLSRLPTAVKRALRDAAEDALKLETEEALRLRDRAVEASVNPVLIVSATDPQMPIVYVNHAFEQVTGYSRDEMMGQNCRILQGSDRHQPELDKVRRRHRRTDRRPRAPAQLPQGWQPVLEHAVRHARPRSAVEPGHALRWRPARHHRDQAVPGRARAPGQSRRADRAGQPQPAARPARAEPARRAPVRDGYAAWRSWISTTSSSSTTAWGTTSATRC
jgi:CheY-like chemotaxis protein